MRRLLALIDWVEADRPPGVPASEEDRAVRNLVCTLTGCHATPDNPEDVGWSAPLQIDNLRQVAALARKAAAAMRHAFYAPKPVQSGDAQTARPHIISLTCLTDRMTGRRPTALSHWHCPLLLIVHM